MSIRMRQDANGGDPHLIPAISPPAGVKSVLIDPPNWQWAVIFAMTLYVVTTTPLFFARMYTRIHVHGKVWWDDYCMVFGWMGLVAFVGLSLVTLKYGAATDEWNVSKADAARLNEIFSKIEQVARVGIFFTKSSILLLYIRYFWPPRSRRTSLFWWTWVIIICNFLYCVALILVLNLQCVGKKKVHGQSCINAWAVLVSASTINVITDSIMLAIPIAAVWNLKLARHRKIGLWIVFAIAALAVAASVARLGYQIPQAKSSNRTILITYVEVLALAEHSIGIIVGCMPTLPSLYNHIISKRRASSASYPSGNSRSRRPSCSANKSFGSAGKNKRRGRYNDTTLLATENPIDESANLGEAAVKNDSSDASSIELGQLNGHGNFTTVKVGTQRYDRDLLSIPSGALLREQMSDTNWPRVEKTVRVDVSRVPV